MNLIEFFTSFPEMSAESLRLFKKSVDGAYRNFSAKYGDMFADVKFNSYRGQVFQDWT